MPSPSPAPRTRSILAPLGLLLVGGALAAQAPGVVDYTPVTPPNATWPIFVDDPVSKAGPGTDLADIGTGRGQALVDVVGPDPSDPTNPDLVGPPDGILDLVMVNSDSPALPLGSDSDTWIYPPVSEDTNGSRVLRGSVDDTLTNVAHLMSPEAPDGFNIEYPGGSPWGAIAADYDGDGDLDLFYPCGAFNMDATNTLMQNDGDGTFTNVSAAAGFGLEQATFGATWFDYDRDGDLDLYETNSTSLFTGVWQGSALPNPTDRLHRNDGGVFTEVGAAAGTNLESSSFSVGVSDLDRDGWPDVVVSCFRRYNKVFYNDGDGTFSFLAPQQNTDFDIEMSEVMDWHPTGKDKDFASIPAEWEPLPVQGLLSIPVELRDFNGDGWTDILYGCWSVQIEDGEPNGAEGALFEPFDAAKLYLNRGDQDGDGLGDGTFREAATELGLGHVGGTMGMVASDFNGDGFVDVYMGAGGPDLLAHVEEDYLYINDGAGWPIDFLRDPDQPLTQVFYEVGALTGTYTNTNMGHGASARLNGDRAMDLILGNGGPAAFGGGQPNFYLVHTGNADESTPRYLEVGLNPTLSPHAAIGARVAVVSAVDLGTARTAVQDVRTGISFASHDGGPLKYGLGDGGALAVEVTWPSGVRQGRLLWPGEMLAEEVTLTEPGFSLGLDARYPETGGIDLGLTLEDVAGTSPFIQLLLLILRPEVGGGFVPTLVPIDVPFAVPPAEPLVLHANGTGWTEGLYTLWAYNQDFQLVGSTSVWHDPAAEAPASLVAAPRVEPKEAAPAFLPAALVDVGRELSARAERLSIAPTRAPLEWESVELTGRGSRVLVDGTTLSWEAGAVRLELPVDRSGTLNFQTGRPVLSLGLPVGCCRLRHAPAGVLVRFEGVAGELRADGARYAADGRPAVGTASIDTAR